ncbi:acyltransferase family protein (plasmid) [Pseudobutyrivibrio xylanivorans]|uniref:Acyltransferase family protein n=1 Tax=Pseudobutyrivibrio xylanivorans TaxID=185007 RepID=A0A5P6VV78_PSEXY|nr:acyltransferase family protein [Pseudobutyrivibrio xylanivorans]QFJ56312.1 acyltransferase family protein [Pseudobutyrivibrio xylanivorans]
MKERLEWIDVARGIGILLVVLGHCFTTVVRKDNMIAGYMYNAIYYFHMPFMFFISGIAFNISIDKYKSADSVGYFIKKSKN